MMTNLFSSFDPSSNLVTTNWPSTIIFMTMIITPFWLITNRSSIFINKITTILHLEFKTLLGSNSFNGTSIMFISIFTLIAVNNFMGLFPYIFTSTSHMVMTLALSLPMWVSFMLYGWINNMNHMFAHLVPQSTPGILMPFMVLIESVSNLIRPGTLAVRLAANMIAGHLLMTLLGNQTAVASMTIISFLLMTQILLLTLESAVAIIQSYVFAVLTTLYSSEVVAH